MAAMAMAVILSVAALPTAAAADVRRLTIRSHVELGGKCVDTPNGRRVHGMHLQMWDCNRAPSQTLTYDDRSLELKMDSLCITSWGRGEAQDAIGLETCNGLDKQRWKIVASKDYYQIVGVDGLCFNLRFAARDNRALLQLFACRPNDVADLWAVIAAP